MEQIDPTELLRGFLTQINEALHPLGPFFAVLDSVMRFVDRSRPSP